MIAPRTYTVILPVTASASAVDFFELITGASGHLALLGLDIGQTTELGDAADEQILWFIKRATGSYTSGSGGASATPAKLNPGDAAATFTAEVGNTTQLAVGSGVLTTLHSGTFNIRSGLQLFWTPETAPRISASSALVVGLGEAPDDSVSWYGTAYVAEYAP